MEAAPIAAIALMVRDTVQAAPIAEPYRQVLITALALPGQILSETAHARWGGLVWTCCVTAGGPSDAAIPVAAASELFMAALDLLDDVEDGEETARETFQGSACLLNASTGLLFLAHQLLLTTTRGPVLVGLLLDSGIRACSGQHADLTPLSRHDSGAGVMDAALTIAAGKSAALVAGLCQVGAACAGAGRARQERYARFGAYLGMMWQLYNDIAALQPGATGKTDIALGRLTLPLACARHMGLSSDAHDPEDSIRAALWTRGPALVTWAVADTYRRYAATLIPQLTGKPAHHALLLHCLER